MKLLIKTIVATAIFMGLQLPTHTKAATPIASKACAIQNSVYKAIGNPDFTLIFSLHDPQKTPANTDAQVTLKHSKRGKIQTFQMTTANGYGSSSLSDPQDTTGVNLNIVFFDRNLKRDGTFRNQRAPEYTFVAGLGSYDYYSMGEDNRKFLLGDVMWRFDRCGQ